MTQPLSPAARHRETTVRLGRVLREIRTSLGLSLQKVEALSGGVWKAVVVGSYERADRAAPVARFSDLLDFYAGVSGRPMRLVILRDDEEVFKTGITGETRAEYGVVWPGDDITHEITCADHDGALVLAATIPGAQVRARLVTVSGWEPPWEAPIAPILPEAPAEAKPAWSGA